jgi:hypothetical protein
LLLARIEKIGHHSKLESPEGRRTGLVEGDEVLLCYGARYAPDQFEALLPGSLEPCHLVAAGGIAARCVKRHAGIKQATRIRPLGLVARGDGRVMNLSEFALPNPPRVKGGGYRLGVVGTSMNAGKTTAAAAVVQGFARKGFRVAAAKVTGTGAGGDRWALQDAGAACVLDFTDFGHPSTYRLPAAEIEELFRRASDSLALEDPDLQVLEVADGLLFEETFALVGSAAFQRRIDGLLLAAADAMGALAGVRLLQDFAIPLLGVCGKLTSSPLAMREARQAVDEPLFTLEQLKQGILLPQVARTSASAVA